MKSFITRFKWLLSVLLLGVAVNSFALTLNIGASTTDTRITLQRAQTFDMNVSGVNGTLSVTNSNASAITLTKISSTTTTAVYRLTGISTGVSNIAFKDKTGTVTTYLKVPLVQGTLDGRQLASNCFQCHGTNATGGVGKLTGMTRYEIYYKLAEMAKSSEYTSNIMKAHARGFTDSQMQMLAAYISQVR